MELEVDNTGTIGLIQDIPGYQLPPEAWTAALNIRPYNDAMTSHSGWTRVFGTPPIAPHFLFPVVSGSQTFWLYTSIDEAAVWDGVSHTNITRVGSPYAAPNSKAWNGTLLAGIPILNNGADVPQYWSQYLTTQHLQNLPNWPATYKTLKMVAFGPFLVAINVTKGANLYPHLVKWSSEVPGPGAIPASWDETDLTNDNGEYDLPDVNAGILQDALGLGAKLMLYKEHAIWSMRFIGGRAVFGFDIFSDTVGILGPGCVALTGDGKKHIVATQDDIVIHDGQTAPISVIDKRMRRAVFSNLDSANFKNSFMFTDVENNETIFCYPELGSVNPTRALVINYKTGSLYEVDRINFRYAVAGPIENPSDELWSDGTDVWDDDTGPWSIQERQKVLAASPDASAIFKVNAGTYLKDADPYEVVLQRVGLAIVGKKRTGELIVDHEVMKFIDRIWPKVRGGAIRIRVGAQMTVDGPVTWGPYQDFDPSTQVYTDHILSARAVAVEFSTPSAIDWALDGYKISVTADGQF